MNLTSKSLIFRRNVSLVPTKLPYYNNRFPLSILDSFSSRKPEEVNFRATSRFKPSSFDHLTDPFILHELRIVGQSEQDVGDEATPANRESVNEKLKLTAARRQSLSAEPAGNN